MRKTRTFYILIFIVVLFTLNFSDISICITEDSWSSKAPMLTPRSRLGTAVVDGRIYAIGGYDENWGLIGTNEVYNPANDTWTTLAPMPIPRAQFGIAVYQNKIYVIGGVINSNLIPWSNMLSINEVTGINEVYDPATNTWETKEPMPTSRFNSQANVVNGKIYLTGGFNRYSEFTNQTEVYDPANNTWSYAASIPNRQDNYASAVINEKIFFMSDRLQIFDPEENQWTSGSSPMNTVYQGAAVATTGMLAPMKIYLVGGTPEFNLTQVYNMDNDSWTLGTSMPTPRQNLALAEVDDKLFAIGGSDKDGNILASNEQYIPIDYDNLLNQTAPPTDNANQTPLQTTLTIFTALAIVGCGIFFVYFKKHHH